MRWFLSISFGVLGSIFATAAGLNESPATNRWSFILIIGLLSAILGAVIGGADDITRAIRAQARRGPDRRETD
jgi:hypothetical protein